MGNAFLQTTATHQDGKTRDIRNFIGPLPALPFEASCRSSPQSVVKRSP